MTKRDNGGSKNKEQTPHLPANENDGGYDDDTKRLAGLPEFPAGKVNLVPPQAIEAVADKILADEKHQEPQNGHGRVIDFYTRERIITPADDDYVPETEEKQKNEKLLEEVQDPEVIKRLKEKIASSRKAAADIASARRLTPADEMMMAGKAAGATIADLTTLTLKTATNTVGLVAGAAIGVGQALITRKKLSEYRVQKLGQASQNYENSLSQFWSTGKMPEVLDEIETEANKRNVTPQSIIQKLYLPENKALKNKYEEALIESPEARIQKETTEKFFKSWLKQYQKSMSERLNENPNEIEKALERNIKSNEKKMLETTSLMPVENEHDLSHYEKVQAAMKEIAAKIAKLFSAVAAKFSLNKETSNESSPAP